MSMTEVGERTDVPTRIGLSTRPWMVAVATGLAFLIFRFEALDQLPVWDGAMGMTPAALTLEATDFDIIGLLGMPDYGSGGPNVHSLSLATWVVALLIRVGGSYQAVLPVLHIISFALVGLLAAGVFRAVSRYTSYKPLSWLAAITAAIYPPMVVQASDVYLDLPLAVAITWAFVYLIESRTALAIGLLTIAAAIKPSAVIAIPSAAYLMWIAERRNPTRMFFLLGPIAVALVHTVLRPRGESSVDDALTVIDHSLIYLSRMPILILLLIVLGFLPLFGWLRGKTREQGWVVLLASVFLPLSFATFFLVHPFVTQGVTALPRYTTMFLPLVVIGFSIALAMITGKRLAFLGCLAFTCIFALNLFGDLEPGSGNAFWLAERSLAYEALLDTQREAFDEFASLARTMPALYDHFAHYRIEFPDSGWADGHIPTGHNLNIEPDMASDGLANLPDQFVMLIEGPLLGGNHLKDIQDDAYADPDYLVDTHSIVKGDFTSHVVLVARVETGPPRARDKTNELLRSQVLDVPHIP